MESIFYQVKPFTVEIKKRSDLIKLGCVDSYDKKDFINVMAGKIVVIKVESENGKILVSKDYPDYAIYDIFINKYIPSATSGVNEEFTFSEIGMALKTSTQNAKRILDASLSKICKSMNLLDIAPE